MNSRLETSKSGRFERNAALEMLRRGVGNQEADFHPDQWEAIDGLVNDQKRILIVQRTGWGKSMVYFVATRALRDKGLGPTIIISPLLALMRNQSAAAKKLGIRAETINSSNKEDWPRVVADVKNDNVDALLISPERLSNDEFMKDVFQPIAQRVGLLVIDEAHCISDWGHDFRPDYRRLRGIVNLLTGNVPVAATTATASERVCVDIQDQLPGFSEIRGALARESLRLSAYRMGSQAQRLAWLAAYLDRNPESHGIIYVLTKRDAKVVTRWLRQQGIEAPSYFSGVEEEGSSCATREDLEQQLLNDEVRALVATTALGMGFDKPNLDFVIHFQAPGSIVGYYQQVGRAGRALDSADGILLFGDEDETIHGFFRENAFPSQECVNRILSLLESASDGLSKPELLKRIDIKPGKLDAALKFLSVENDPPVFKLRARWYRTANDWVMPVDRIEWLTNTREREWHEVLDYIKSPSCRMVILQGHLGDNANRPCGRCDNCEGIDAEGPDLSVERVREASLFLKQSEMPLKPRKLIPKSAFVEFDLKGKIEPEAQAREGRILSVWGDCAWGESVKDGKHVGRFDDELVDAFVEMIRERWKPDPSPEWVTFVPSLRRKALVKDFAQQVAERLGLPLCEVISCRKENQQQKLQANSYHQCRNLDGVFGVDETEIPSGPVLLVDDVVRSGWTLTICAVLLRNAGSGPVFPSVLATTNPGGA